MIPRRRAATPPVSYSMPRTSTGPRCKPSAAEVGYSETAFLVPAHAELGGPGTYDVRYFAPTSEVPFCGHATIASAVALVEHGDPGPFTFRTASGDVPVLVPPSRTEGEPPTATLTSVVPQVKRPRLRPRRRGARLPRLVDGRPRPQPAGAPGLRRCVAPRDPGRDPPAPGRARLRLRPAAWASCRSTTGPPSSWCWREAPTRFHARDPFPPGGVVEDPATGAAAAALGAYLVEVGVVHPPERIQVVQGEDMGRPQPPRRRRGAWRSPDPGQRPGRARSPT